MKILRYLWRDKVDLLMFLAFLFAGIQYFFWTKDVTPAFLIAALYSFGVMHRIGTIIDEYEEKIEELKNGTGS